MEVLVQKTSPQNFKYLMSVVEDEIHIQHLLKKIESTTQAIFKESYYMDTSNLF